MTKEEFQLFLEELWGRIEDLRVGSGLTDGEVVAALEAVRRRLVRRMKDEE